MKWRERRDLFPEGVASGDPDDKNVILWTRAGDASVGKLFVEVAEDENFRKIVTTATAPVSQAADGTCRVLAGGLKSAHVYRFRFMAPDGSGSRIGRTITAPAPNDPRPVRFAFVSCQNANQGAQNAYRRMIHEDERATESERLVSCCTWATYLRNRLVSGKSFDLFRPITIGGFATWCAIHTARRCVIYTFPPRSRIIALSTKAICATRIFRMRRRAGRSCRCGITTNSVGRAGRVFSGSSEKIVQLKP